MLFRSFDAHNAERAEGGWLVSQWERNPNDRLSINMPHWSATIWALERARVAQWALKCDPSVLVKINGDAIYSAVPLAPIEEAEAESVARYGQARIGQLRRKA